jgi:glycogen operon protein
MDPSPWFATEGAPHPLGVSFVEAENAYNFALYSKEATSVSLLLYAAGNLVEPARRVELDPLHNRSGRIWHCRLKRDDLAGARYYGYSVDGPAGRGNRFDPAKILLDPYARLLFVPDDFSTSLARGPGSNAGRALLGEIPAARAAFDWTGDRRIRHTHDLVIYEMHVRGFTRHGSSGVPESAKGTYAGVVAKIPYLVELGVTAVELLPVYAFVPEPGGNYWGYMPLSFFAPHPAYAASGAPADRIDEFRAMVKALHQAGIEVILDVVYNHTAELGESGPTLSYRGIDNSNYYLLKSDLDTYADDAGTGNVLRVGHPAVRNLVLESLRFWVNEMHVDGFRFDLASILTRDIDGNIRLDDPSIISEISSDPCFADVRLIAEPWDLATYQLGRSFPGISWMQWNGAFRDEVRSFVKSDANKVTSLMRRLYGSDDLFPDRGTEVYRPFQSVNFVDCHDGFCLYDLVSYDAKHNLANGSNNRDGADANFSWNCGFEGDDGAPAETLALRRRQVKNFCVLLLLSNGTPMFVMGDELMRTQRGNNNPYNQDNETSWLDFGKLEKNGEAFRFFKMMIAFRKDHPSIGRGRYWREDIRWYGVSGGPDLSYGSRSLAYCLHGASQGDADIYVMINAYWEPLRFTVQEPGPFRRVIDTAESSPGDFAAPGAEIPLASSEYVVAARSVVVLLRAP